MCFNYIEQKFISITSSFSLVCTLLVTIATADFFLWNDEAGHTEGGEEEKERKKEGRERTTHHLKSKCERTNKQVRIEFSSTRTHTVIITLEGMFIISVRFYIIILVSLIFSVESG
jgi:hypothetical protein